MYIVISWAVILSGGRGDWAGSDSYLVSIFFVLWSLAKQWFEHHDIKVASVSWEVTDSMALAKDRSSHQSSISGEIYHIYGLRHWYGSFYIAAYSVSFVSSFGLNTWRQNPAVWLCGEYRINFLKSCWWLNWFAWKLNKIFILLRNSAPTVSRLVHLNYVDN